MKNKITIIAATITLMGLYSSCKKDKDPVTQPVANANEKEVITTLTITFIDSSNSGTIITATFKDADGDGGNPPTLHETIKLKANTTYLASILLLNETKNPIDTVSNEVKKEANDHLLFYKYTGVTVACTYLDLDSNKPPLPLGLSTKWKTGNAGTGTSRIILKHQAGVKNGTEVPGETDVDVTFQTILQ
jgi:hypothetical protein